MKKLAPYQIFFPFGIFNAILAVGVWFVFNLGWFNTPAIFIHSRLIVGGFLWSFITGFLMTAIPRMTGTAGANKWEYLAASLLLVAQIPFSFLLGAAYFYENQMALIAFLILYGGRRILKSTKPVPVFFSHVGVALVLALSGAKFHLDGNAFMGIHLYHLGAILLLILGIGTRFFSFLSGLPSEFEGFTSKGLRLSFHLSGVCMGVLLFAAGKGFPLAYLGLAALSLNYLFMFWRVQRPSNRPSALKYGVRLSAAMIPTAFFLSWLWPLTYVTWFHLIFIGCFGLMTFAVATRVTLAHGSYSTDLEMKSTALWWLISFLALGIISRVAYGFSESHLKIGFLHLAATFWVLAVLSWCRAFLPKIFKAGPQAKPSC
jgi:uncharacterized protein involved in response to NO